jgi:hypothetical protein
MAIGGQPQGARAREFEIASITQTCDKNDFWSCAACVAFLDRCDSLVAHDNRRLMTSKALAVPCPDDGGDE